MSYNNQPSLFDEVGKEEKLFSIVTNESSAADVIAITGYYGITGFSFLPFDVRLLFDLSVNAFYTVVYARMSELPLTRQIISFGQKVLVSAEKAAASQKPSARCETEIAQRRAAEQAAVDRGDPDTLAVLEAAHKVWCEIHRLQGLLRFCPDENGVYVARCEPDHFVLPALGPHFRERFGQTPWVIVDEKRRLRLNCIGGGPPELCGAEESPSAKPQGEWENLWRLYHKTINNESRNNRSLQRGFMPKRYWKYLTEMQ